MKEEKDSLIFVKHILENIEDIEKFSKNLSEKEFEKDVLKQKAIIRSIEVIGEATKNIPDSFKEKYPKISWKDIVGTRDKLIHHYFGVDLNSVWKVVKEDIPELKTQLLDILKKEIKN